MSEMNSEMVRELNFNALVALMGEFELTIHAREFAKWRPTVRAEGEIPGVGLGIMLATDGNVCWFQVGPTEVVMAHIQHFNGKVETLFRLPKSGEVKEKSTKPKKPHTPEDEAKEVARLKRAHKKQLLLSLLDDIMEDEG